MQSNSFISSIARLYGSRNSNNLYGGQFQDHVDACYLLLPHWQGIRLLGLSGLDYTVTCGWALPLREHRQSKRSLRIYWAAFVFRRSVCSIQSEQM